MKNKTEEKISEPVNVRLTSSEKEAKASVNKQVMTTVTTQIATESNERAVILRDQGRIEEARKVLEENAAYLGEQAKRYDSEKLEKLRKSNLDDARSLSAHEWNKTRKSMRAKQYKDKTQQSY